MASSVSAVVNTYADIKQYSPDFQLLGAVFQAKQGKYDANKARLQNYRNQLGILDIAKDEDQAYLDDRLSQVTDIANKYSNLDLSSDSLTDSLIGTMGQVFDGNVKNAIVGTKLLRKEQTEWAKAREKNDGSYSDRNYSYAMQGAHKWLNDGVTGTTYNGGGQFIAYSDYNKKINDALPKAIELIKSEKKRSIAGPAGGVGGIVTEVSVDRGDLERVLYSQLNENDKKQMQIDAWAKYQGLPDDILKEEYENHFNNQLDEANSKITSIKALMEGTTDPDMKNSYAESLAQWKQKKDTLEGPGSYENVVNSYGKAGAYNTLHQDKFFDGYLDAYSKDPEITDIKVNEIDKANLEHQLNLAKFAETKRHNAVTESTALLKAKGTAGTSTEDSSKNPFLTGKDFVVDTNKEKNSIYEARTKNAGVLLDGISEDFQKLGVSKAEADTFMKGKRFADLVANLKPGQQEVMIGGKMVKLPQSIQQKMMHYNLDVHSNKAFTNRYNDVDVLVSQMQKSLGVGLATNNSTREDVPNFKVKYVKTANGFAIAETDPKKEAHNYVRLLNMQHKGLTMTEADKKTLALYGQLHLQNDESNSKSRADFLQRRTLDLLSKDLNSKEVAKIDLTVRSTGYVPNTRRKDSKGKEIPGTGTYVGGRDVWFSNYGVGDIANTGTQTSLYKEEKEYKLAKGTIQQYQINPNQVGEQNLKIAQAKVKAFESRPLAKKGPSDQLEEGWKHIEASIEGDLMESAKLAIPAQQVLAKKGHEKAWTALAPQLGLETTSNKDILVTPEVKDGIATGNFLISTNVTYNKKGEPVKTSEGNVVSKSKLKELGVANLDIKNNRRYNAQSNIAPTIDLGNGIYKNTMSKGLPKETKEKLLLDANDYYGGGAVASTTEAMLQKYASGGYSVKLEPDKIDGIYKYKVYDSKTGEESSPGFFMPAPSMLEDGLVSNIMYSPKNTVDKVILQYISAVQQNIDN